MTEREITKQRIIFMRDRQTLFIRETDFKIGILKDKLRKITTAYKMPKQKQRATNFDYKNEIEVGDPGTV